MLNNKIELLTTEQEKLLPIYREKWKKLVLSTDRVDRNKATNAIKYVYRILGKVEPKILFFPSPNAVLVFLNDLGGYSLVNHLDYRLKNELKTQLQTELGEQIGSHLDQGLMNQYCGFLVSEPRSRLEISLRNELERQLRETELNQLSSQISGNLYEFIKNTGCLCAAPQLDFYISVLNLPHNPSQWEAYQLLVTQGSYILAFDGICLVSDCPTRLSLDSENNFHGEGEPAIEFGDGFFRQYIYHGVTIPEKYGMLHPHQWQSKWILEEKNAEIRRLLIQTIGYGRICQELQAQTIDSYLEYTLLKINEVDIEPMYLLKMICPSTGFIHVLRVPPNITSAREAICWVNWGINPEEFAIQS